MRAGLLLVFLIPVIVFAQSLEDDDPSDRRYWGNSSRYSSQVESLGSTRVESLPIPVFGVALSSLTKNFGDARGGGTRTHQGLDIMAKEGTPIGSPTDAVVLRVGNGANSGLYIRTANPGGENFVYMHLSSIASGIEAGRRVKRGEIIGFVGNTGNASGGPAHLHFEIRSGGTATDPYPRLNSVFTQSEIDASVEDATSRGITIPAFQTTTPTPSAPTRVPANVYKPTLVFGETNADVRTLQQFLISNPKGASGTRLANTGATGYFGSLTQAALIEYQSAAGLSVSGVVDAATYTLVFGQADAIPVNPVSSGFTRDLELGMGGADVRMLQVFLNAKGFIVASSGAGSPGNESDYFGAKTQVALAQYQKANGITPAAGYFGPKTRSFAAR